MYLAQSTGIHLSITYILILIGSLLQRSNINPGIEILCGSHSRWDPLGKWDAITRRTSALLKCKVVVVFFSEHMYIYMNIRTYMTIWYYAKKSLWIHIANRHQVPKMTLYHCPVSEPFDSFRPCQLSSTWCPRMCLSLLSRRPREKMLPRRLLVSKSTWVMISHPYNALIQI